MAGSVARMSSSLEAEERTESSVDTELTASRAVLSDFGSEYWTLSWEIRSIANTWKKNIDVLEVHCQRNTLNLNSGLSGLLLIGSTPIFSTLKCIPNLSM